MRDRFVKKAPFLIGVLLGVVTACHTFAAVPSIESRSLRITFDPNSGNVTRFDDVRRQRSVLDSPADTHLWEIEGSHENGQPVVFTPAQAREFSWHEQQGSLQLVWRAFEDTACPELVVVVDVQPGRNSDQLTWHLRLENASSGVVKRIAFPRMSPLTPQQDERLAVPVWMGELVANPRVSFCTDQAITRREWESPGILSLQCLALYKQNGPGFCITTDDTRDYLKRFAVFGNREGLGIEVVHLPERQQLDRGTYVIPYVVRTEIFVGDWFTVAEHYRNWATQQPWVQTSRLITRAVPEWVQKTDLWIWNRGKSGGVLEPAIVLRRHSGMVPSVFWHWWHGCAYDAGFPEYFPPREGDESFRAALARAHEEGIHALIYMNQRLWGMTTESWKTQGAERFAVKQPDGTVHPEIYNIFTRTPCASMCMGTSFWRDTYAALAEHAVKAFGVDGIYMDQACSNLACYDPSHGHPVGGGTYWLNGFRLLQQNIRARCAAQNDLALAGEGCGESWLPYLDLMLSLQVSRERYAAPGEEEPIPFFHAVYHPFAVLFGNYSSLVQPPYDELWPAESAPPEALALLDKAFAQQFRLEQARAWVWGQQPTLANFLPEHIQSRSQEIEFFLSLARLRRGFLDYFLYGTMLRPPTIPLDQEEIPISRLSIYAGRNGAVTQYRKRMPIVLCGAWLSPDHDVAIAVVNISDRPQSFKLVLDRKQYPLSPHHYARMTSSTGITAPVQPKRRLRNVTLEVTLSPVEARVYEWKRLPRHDVEKLTQPKHGS